MNIIKYENHTVKLYFKPNKIIAIIPHLDSRYPKLYEKIKLEVYRSVTDNFRNYVFCYDKMLDGVTKGRHILMFRKKM